MSNQLINSSNNRDIKISKDGFATNCSLFYLTRPPKYRFSILLPKKLRLIVINETSFRISRYGNWSKIPLRVFFTITRRKNVNLTEPIVCDRLLNVRIPEVAQPTIIFLVCTNLLIQYQKLEFGEQVCSCSISFVR